MLLTKEEESGVSMPASNAPWSLTLKHRIPDETRVESAIDLPSIFRKVFPCLLVGAQRVESRRFELKSSDIYRFLISVRRCLTHTFWAN